MTVTPAVNTVTITGLVYTVSFYILYIYIYIYTLYIYIYIYINVLFVCVCVCHLTSETHWHMKDCCDELVLSWIVQLHTGLLVLIPAKI